MSDDFVLTQHVVDSYAMFYEKSEVEDVRTAIISSLEIEAPIASRLVGRPSSRDESRYWLSCDRTGIFVAIKDREARLVFVTFLRFYSIEQHRLAVRLYPGGVAPERCLAKWTKFLEQESDHAQDTLAQADQAVSDDDEPTALEKLRAKTGGPLRQASSALKKKHTSIGWLEQQIALAYAKVSYDPSQYTNGNENSPLKPSIVTMLDGVAVAIGSTRSGVIKASIVSKRSDTWALEPIKAVSMIGASKMSDPTLKQTSESKVAEQESPEKPPDWLSSLTPPDLHLRHLPVCLSEIKFSKSVKQLLRKQTSNVILTQLALIDQIEGLREGSFYMIGCQTEFYLVKRVCYSSKGEAVEFWVCKDPGAEVTAEEAAAAKLLGEKGWAVFPPQFD